MARYFQAPVMQPVDYGYEMPFAQKMGYIQQQQSLQDKGRAEVESLYDVGQLDALKQDYSKRDALINARYDETDKLITDDEGNIRDFRNIKPAVTSIARRRAKEEQAGGSWNAIASNRASAIEYQKTITEMHAKGEIGIKRKSALISDAFNSYEGIGDKDALGAYNQFSGRSAAKEVDDIAIAYEYAKDTAFQQLQAAGVVDKNGLLADNETIENIMASPKFKNVMGGMYVQTGSVEFRTMETIKNITMHALSTNNQLKEDILQEGWIEGHKTEEEQKAYYSSRLNNLALNAAEKYASIKFSPQLTKNWVAEKALELKNAKAVVDYEKQKEINTFEWNTDSRTYVVTDPVALNNTIEAGEKALSTLQEKIDDILLKGDNATPADRDNLHEYQVQKQTYEIQVSGARQQKKAVGTHLLTKHGEGYAYEKAFDVVKKFITNNVVGYASNTAENMASFQEEAAAFLKNEAGFSEEEIIEAITDNKLFTLDVGGKSLGRKMSEIAKNNNVGFAQPFFTSAVTGDEHMEAYAGNEVNTAYVLEDDIKAVQKEGGFKVSQTATAHDSDKGNLKALNGKLTEQLQDGDADMLNTVTGDRFSIDKVLKEVGANSYTKFHAYDLKEPHPVTGTPQVQVTIEYVDPKTKKVHQVSRVLTTPHGTATGTSIIKNKRVAASENLKAAMTRDQGTVKDRDIAESSLDLGYAALSGSNIGHVDKLKPGESTMVIVPGSEDAPIFFKRTAAGKLKAGYGTDDGQGGWYKPDFLNNVGLIEDVRYTSQDEFGSGKIQFDNVSAFTENYGWIYYNQDTNPLENPRNRN